MENNINTTTTTEGQRGATITTVYVERQVKAFSVFETELDVLSSLNAQATVFFSVGSAFITYAVGIWTNSSFATQLTPEGKLANEFVAPGLVFISIVFYSLAIMAWWKRRRTLGDIRRQSKSATK
ncbi:MAG: hypothetical protein ACLPTF_02285 [Steroidobacteraceae bacterium]